MGNKVFTFGDIRIREVKGKYYVYVIEKGQNRERRDNYVGSLEQIVKEYYNMKCRGRDLNPGHGLERPALGGHPLRPPMLIMMNWKELE